jgi:hypothetical protein
LWEVLQAPLSPVLVLLIPYIGWRQKQLDKHVEKQEDIPIYNPFFKEGKRANSKL